MATPETHHLMCKKVAQLTKVVYHLNTKNEDQETRCTPPVPPSTPAPRACPLPPPLRPRPTPPRPPTRSLHAARRSRLIEMQQGYEAEIAAVAEQAASELTQKNAALEEARKLAVADAKAKCAALSAAHDEAKAAALAEWAAKRDELQRGHAEARAAEAARAAADAAELASMRSEFGPRVTALEAALKAAMAERDKTADELETAVKQLNSKCRAATWAQRLGEVDLVARRGGLNGSARWT